MRYKKLMRLAALQLACLAALTAFCAAGFKNTAYAAENGTADEMRQPVPIGEQSDIGLNAAAEYTEILAFTDFSDGVIPDAFSGGTGSYSVENSSMKIGSTGTGMGNRRVELPEALKNAIQDGQTQYKIYIAAETKVTSEMPVSAEIGMVNAGYSTLRRFVSHYYKPGTAETDGYKVVYNSSGNTPENLIDQNGVRSQYGTEAQLPFKPDSDDVLSWVVLLEGQGSTAAAVYYCDNTEIGRCTLTGLDEAAAIRFSVQGYGEGTAANAAFFDNLQAYALLNGDGEITGEISTEEIEPAGSIVAQYSQPLNPQSRVVATVNGQEVDAGRISITGPILTIAAPLTGYGYGETLEISLTGAENWFGTKANEITATVQVGAEPSYQDGQKIEIVPYQTFEREWNEWDISNWTRDAQTQVLRADTSGTQKQGVVLPSSLMGVINDETSPYQLVMRARMRVSWITDAPTTIPLLEMGLSNDTGGSWQSFRRLVQLQGNAGSLSFRYATGNQLTSIGLPQSGMIPMELDEWVDIVIVINGIGDTGKISYWRNGELLDADLPISGMKSATQVRLMAQNGITAEVDDFETYALLGDGVTIPAGASISGSESPIELTEDVQITFTTDMDINTVLQRVAIDGEQIDQSRVKMGNTSRTVLVSAPAGGWDSQKQYTLTLSVGAKDIFGREVVVPPGGMPFRTGGAAITVKNAVLAYDAAAQKYTAVLEVRNVDTAPAELDFLLVTYCAGDDGIRQMEQQITQTLTVPNNGEWISASIEITDAQAASAKAMLWNSGVPVLENPVMYGF